MEIFKVTHSRAELLNSGSHSKIESWSTLPLRKISITQGLAAHPEGEEQTDEEPQGRNHPVHPYLAGDRSICPVSQRQSVPEHAAAAEHTAEPAIPKPALDESRRRAAGTGRPAAGLAGAAAAKLSAAARARTLD